MEKSSSEIEKLAERISKDPKSKLFVPLAEEYKKAGDIERAIAVLTEGLKNNPGYITAKSFLGRLLLDQGNLVEAQKEFQEVVKSAPDNVLAHRKLGEIHAIQGRTAEAVACFKAVLAFNPKDAELIALIADIEAGRDVQGKIVKTKHPSAADQSTPAPTHASLPPVARAVPAQASVRVNAEEPEEVLIFEQLDAENTNDDKHGQLPTATQDMFADLSLESASMRESLSEGKGSGLLDAADHGRIEETGAANSSEGEAFPEAVATPSGDAASGPFRDEPALETTQAPWGGEEPGNLIPAFGTVPDAESAAVPTDVHSDDSNVFANEAVLPAQATADGEEAHADIITGFGTTPEFEGAPGFDDAAFSDSTAFGGDVISAEQANAGAEGSIADLLPSFGTAQEQAGGPDLQGGSLFDAEAAQDGWSVEPVAAEDGTASALEISDTEGQGQASAQDNLAGGFLVDAGPAIGSFDDSEPAPQGSPLRRGEPAPEASFFRGAEPDIRSDEIPPESDDFTTDTLAELYIAQGFYEKAIEIYERMLVDKPHSKALKDKLANVRAMGSSATDSEELGTPVLFEPQESEVVRPNRPLPVAEPRQWQPPAEVEPREYIPPPPDEESPVFESGFKPVEYVPPAEPSRSPAQPLKQTLPVFSEEQAPVAQKTDLPGREQTIERLENWLKNIMKER